MVTYSWGKVPKRTGLKEHKAKLIQVNANQIQNGACTSHLCCHKGGLFKRDWKADV